MWDTPRNTNMWFSKPGKSEIKERETNEPKICALAKKIREASDTIDNNNEENERGNVSDLESRFPELVSAFKGLDKHDQLRVAGHAGREGSFYSLFIEQAGMHMAYIAQDDQDNSFFSSEEGQKLRLDHLTDGYTQQDLEGIYGYVVSLSNGTNLQKALEEKINTFEENAGTFEE